MENKMDNKKQLPRAIILIITSAFCFAVMNLCVSMSGDVPVIQKTFFRNFFAMLIASVTMIKNKHYILPKKGERTGIILRSAAGFLGMLGNFYALSYLGEASLQDAELLPSCAGFLGGACAGLAYTFVRKLTSGGTKSYYIVFFFSAFSTVCAAPALIFYYSPMTIQQFLFLLGAGAAAAGGQFAITASYSYAPAKEVSIYDYSQIIFAGMLGVVFKSEIPDLFSFIGCFIIIAAALLMFLYNNRKGDILK